MQKRARASKRKDRHEREKIVSCLLSTTEFNGVLRRTDQAYFGPQNPLFFIREAREGNIKGKTYRRRAHFHSVRPPSVFVMLSLPRPLVFYFVGMISPYSGLSLFESNSLAQLFTSTSSHELFKQEQEKKKFPQFRGRNRLMIFCSRPSNYGESKFKHIKYNIQYMEHNNRIFLPAFLECTMNCRTL